MSQNPDFRGMTGNDRHLTTRQIEVLGLMANGKQRSEIAEILGISSATINNYVKSAMDITGTANATGLVAFAMRKGWIQ